MTIKAEWREIAQAAGASGIKAFNGIWYQGEPFDEAKQAILRPLFERYPLGQDNFKKWAKQVVRNIFERDIRRQSCQPKSAGLKAATG